MRKILLAVIFSIVVTSVHAGSANTPKMQEEEVSASTTSHSPWLIFMVLLIAIGASPPAPASSLR